MGENNRVRDCFAHILLNPFKQFMAVLDRPLAGDEHVHRNEPAGACLAGP